MTENVWIALVGAVQVITLALIGKVAKDGSRTRNQVENAHIDESGEPYNLRDNIDENQAELLTAIGRVEREQSGMKRDIGRLDDRDVEHGKHHERVDEKFERLTNKVEATNRNLSTHLEWAHKIVDDLEKK